MKEEKADMAEKKEEKEEETKDEDPPPPAEEWSKYKFLLFSVLEREILQGGGKYYCTCLFSNFYASNATNCSG